MRTVGTTAVSTSFAISYAAVLVLLLLLVMVLLLPVYVKIYWHTQLYSSLCCLCRQHMLSLQHSDAAAAVVCVCSTSRTQV